MDDFLFPTILFLVFIGIPLGFLWFLYFVGTKLQSRKTGIWLASIMAFIYLLAVLYLKFENKFFFEADAEEILIQNEIVLKDDFEIINHEATFAIGDSYKTFTLKISENDKKNLIAEFSSKSRDTLKKNTNFEYSENELGFTKDRKNLQMGDREFIFIPKSKENILEYQQMDE